MSQVSLRARITIDGSSKIGKYTCMGYDSVGNIGSAVLTMQESGGSYYPQPTYPGVTSKRKLKEINVLFNLYIRILFFSEWWP